jgi:biopolymer transport protein ExbD
MAATDDEIREDLRAAYGSDLPGEEFTTRVLERIDGPAARVREISVATPRWPLLGIGVAAAAAVVLLAVLLGPGLVTGPETGEPDARPASPGPGKAELPQSGSAEAPTKEARVVIHLSPEGEIRVDDTVMTLEVLKKHLAKKADEHRTDEHGRPSSLAVRIRTDRRTPWRQVQWIMQTCADPRVRIYRISFAAARGEEEADLPVPLPKDRGPRPTQIASPRLTVRLTRGEKEETTRIECTGEDLGRGKAAWGRLFVRIHELRSELPAAPRLDASATVPHEEVVRAIDLLRAAGYEEIRFVGAPPPGKGSDGIRARAHTMAILRPGEMGTTLELGAGRTFPLAAGLERLLSRCQALRDAGIPRPVTLVVHPGVPAADAERVTTKLREARLEVEVLHED